MTFNGQIDRESKESGVSLVELAIVIVIIGVMMAVVSGGRSLLHSSRIKAVIGDIAYYMSAVDEFRTKYNYRPGDLPHANNYFIGNAVSLTPDDDARTFINNGPDLIFGTGDDLYFLTNQRGNGYWDGPGNPPSTTNATERNLIWPQLFQAGFIKDDLDVPAPITSQNITLGTHRPLSDIDGAGWTFVNSMHITAPGDAWYYHILRIGSGATEDLTTGMLSVADHIDIDAKIDSPNTPLSGSYVVGVNPSNGTNVGTTDCAVAGAEGFIYPTNTSLLCTGNAVEISDPPCFNTATGLPC